jgi:cytoskeletal protein RodZ
LRFETLNALNNNHGRMARQLARRQQRERIVGILVVGLGIVVLAVAILAVREPNGHVTAAQTNRSSASSVAKQTSSRPTSSASTTTAASSTSAHQTSDTHSGHAVKNVPLVVLNNTTIHGLATAAARRVEAGGWTVTESGNLTNDILSTCAYYDPADPAAKPAAEALRAQYPTIKRVEPKFAELPSGPVVVVLTPDYSAG